MANVPEIPQVPLPPPLTRAAGIGEAARNVLIRFLVEVLNRVATTLSSVLRHATSTILELLERELNSLLGPFYAFILASPKLPPEIRSIIERVRTGEFQVGAALAGSLATGALGSMSQSALGPISRLIGYAMDNTFHTARLDFSTWRMAGLRDGRYHGDMQIELGDLGWTLDQIHAADLAAEQRLGATELLTLWLRGEIGDGDLSLRLTQQGIAPSQFADLKKLSKGIPGPADLVQFALREAWRDDVAGAWGYDQGRPGAFDEWMKKSGYDLEWAIAYWRAHWQIPSPGQIFEMFHRGAITADQMRAGIIINDIAPGWVDKLLSITYSLLTRVDVKRALRYGLLGPADVLGEYRKQGYSERDAAILRDIAVAETVDETAGITRDSIISAYRKRRLGRDEALAMLSSIGIMASVAAFLLGQADRDYADALLDRRIDVVGERYKDGLIAANTALTDLAALGVGADEAALYVQEWTLAKTTKTARPTRSNLDTFFTEGTISNAQYRAEMKTLGYADTYTGWYLGSLTFKRAKETAAEDERAQKERIRIDADRRSSAYERAKAAIDRDVAELNAAIADAQVALVAAENERDAALSHALPDAEIAALEGEYLPLFADVDGAIAAARLSIQKLSRAITGKAAEVNDLRRSLAAGRDVVLEDKLRAQRLTLQTQLALYDQQVAVKKTDIARLEEGIPLLETPEQKADFEQRILTLKTQIAEVEESAAGARVDIEKIDERLPVQLTAVRRAEIERTVALLQADEDDLRAQVDDLDVAISLAQQQRLSLQQKYDARVTALPGREEQIRIRAGYQATIARVEARIMTLKSNVAKKRLEKATLEVGWRQ